MPGLCSRLPAVWGHVHTGTSDMQVPARSVRGSVQDMGLREGDNIIHCPTCSTSESQKNVINSEARTAGLSEMVPGKWGM